MAAELNFVLTVRSVLGRRGRSVRERDRVVYVHVPLAARVLVCEMVTNTAVRYPDPPAMLMCINNPLRGP